MSTQPERAVSDEEEREESAQGRGGGGGAVVCVGGLGVEGVGEGIELFTDLYAH